MIVRPVAGWMLVVALQAATAGTAAAAEEGGFECLLEPWQVIEVRTPVDGIIGAITVNRGDVIRRGQPLVELQSQSEKAAVELARLRSKLEGPLSTARNRNDYATKRQVRLTDLEKEKFISMQARDEADAEKRLAEAELLTALENRELAKVELLRAQEQLALRTVSAPFAGVVVDRMLNVGELAEAGSGRKPVLKVAQIDPMRADVALPAALFGQVKVGSKATVRAQVGGARFNAVVRSVDRVIDAASSTFVARLEVPNPGDKVPGGSRCSASIEGVAPAARQRP
ncbi:efflux RND transporter periplasmic adaptor subunit [Roseateles violae]|uniref:Efflux RND transporter periplasmic adaptor subunit n=1 Tax=Roseateles violae TaxID=3058042 RepID=A0ABT8DY51_9BURK|nr:efflux RND transporter periplasmic adaptor subunit [Pelomonas sp. PFR6]MDN3922094.1 efflux RND transporter periplasmic adaptor subunit [Pelomonas sp. PFR6]